MSARDDFELVRQACSLASDHPAATTHYPAAFNRLFTPRPLRDLVAEGWRGNAWVKDGGECDSNGYAECPGWSMFLLAEPKVIHEKFMGCLAIPILTPEDMGEG